VVIHKFMKEKAMMGTTRALVFFCVLGLLGISQARAQAVEAEHFAHMVGGWELVQVKHADGSVMGFWGIPLVEVEVGNIRRLWFEALPEGEWAVWGFEPVAMSEKAALLAGAGADPDSLDFLFYREFLAPDDALNQDIDGGVDGLVTKGFIDGDPLTEQTAALTDPEPVVDLLADSGYPVAPGMTELLVDGTAGADVNMNQATKQLLNCLRSAHPDCEECVCTIVEGPMSPGPWTVLETELDGGVLRCEYSRVETHIFWQYGKYPEDCVVCDAGSPDHPLEYEISVEFTEYWYDMDNCPDEPFF